MNPPGQFSTNFFQMENGDVAKTLEKFDFSRERGHPRARFVAIDIFKSREQW